MGGSAYPDGGAGVSSGLLMAAVALLVIPRNVTAELRIMPPLPADPGTTSRARTTMVGHRSDSETGARVKVDAGTALRLAASWDLLAAALRSGLPVPEAMRAITNGLPDDAGRAVRATGNLLALGADPEQAWDPALRCPETAPLARAARRTSRSGTALATVAAELARTARAGVIDLAEAAAQRAGVLITLPLGLCFLPGFLCLGVIPVVFGLAGQLTVLD